MQPVKILAVIVNIFIPGIGTMMMGRIGTGVIQLILLGLANLMIWTFILGIIGWPLYAIVWIWAVVGVALMDDPGSRSRVT